LIYQKKTLSDEQKFGFSYAEVDKYIREGIEPEGYCTNNPNVLKIDEIHRRYTNNKFKTDIIRIPHFEPSYIEYITESERN